MMVSPTQLSVIRMVPTAKAAARAGQGRLAVYRLLNSWRGWDGDHTPVADARWAMGQVREELGELPLGLIGHSLGGRAALLAGDEPDVVSVVALNPWVYPTDDADLTGRRVLIVHGLRDRIASPGRARAVARNLARTADVEFVEVAGGKHAMLRHGREFDRRPRRSRPRRCSAGSDRVPVRPGWDETATRSGQRTRNSTTTTAMTRARMAMVRVSIGTPSGRCVLGPVPRQALRLTLSGGVLG